MEKFIDGKRWNISKKLFASSSLRPRLHLLICDIYACTPSVLSVQIPQNQNSNFQAEMEKVYWEQEMQKNWIPLFVNFHKLFVNFHKQFWFHFLLMYGFVPFLIFTFFWLFSFIFFFFFNFAACVSTCVNPSKLSDIAYWWWLPCLCNQ